MTFRPQEQAEETDTGIDDAEESQDSGSIGDDLSAAIEEVAGKTDPSASADGGVPDEEAKLFADPEKEKAGPATKDDGEKEDSDKPDSDTDKPDADSPSKETASLKAPTQWDPKAREQWGKVPVDIQKLIHDREKFVNQTLQESSVARQTHTKLSELAQSYAPIMAAEGVSNPLDAVNGLFKTVAELRIGSPQQKAVRMAALIGHYGIDIEALDTALSGQTPQPSQNSQFESMLDQRMAPVNQLLQELQQRQTMSQQQTQQEAEKAVSEFQGEFLPDVRIDMADLIDMAASRGQNMSLQDAYDKAILLRPEIQEVLAQRKADEDIRGNQQRLDGKREASSSLSGKQSGGGGQNVDDSIRGVIEEAWGDQGRI